jgi:hypothetical protein
MGVYMGVFNLFIVIPQVVMSLVMPQVIRHVLGDDPVRVVMFGGGVMLVGALSMLIVRDVARPVPVGDVLEADESAQLTTTMTAQPVPSTGMTDEEGSEK